MEEINWGMIIVQSLCVWFAYKLGQVSIIHKIGRDLQEEMKKKGLKVDRDDEGNISISREETVLKVERVDSQYFAYAIDGQFLAQATDFRSLFQNLKERYPGKSFRIDRYQAEFTDEEASRMVKSIFEVFGDKEQKDGQRGN